MKTLIVVASLVVGALLVGGCQKESYVETEAQKIAAQQANLPQEKCDICGRSFPEGSLKPFNGQRACMTCIDAAKGAD